MKPGQGKNKGSGFERDVGTRISLWLTNGARKDLLCRTVGSGAQFTSSKFCQGHPGDLMAQHPLAFTFCDAFVIECKFWRDLELIKFLSHEGNLFKAMQQVRNQAIEVKKSWWLVAKQNHRDTILLLPSEVMKSELKFDYHLLFQGSVIMCSFTKFLSEIPIDEFVQRRNQ